MINYFICLIHRWRCGPVLLRINSSSDTLIVDEKLYLDWIHRNISKQLDQLRVISIAWPQNICRSFRLSSISIHETTSVIHKWQNRDAVEKMLGQMRINDRSHRKTFCHLYFNMFCPVTFVFEWVEEMISNTILSVDIIFFNIRKSSFNKNNRY